MSLYVNLRDQFGSSIPEERLKILRAEMISDIAAIQGYAALLGRIDPSATKDLPDNFSEWVDGMTKAASDLRDILDALTDPRERT
jgi:hypothetical protein